MKNLNHGQSWPIVIKNLDRQLGQTKTYQRINNALNIILIIGCLILIGVELWMSL